MEINIAKDFTNKPGGRFISEGKYSGEEFRETLLYPKYVEAQKLGQKLSINLDDCYGYATSFLEEAFAGLARKLRDKDILRHIDIISNDEPTLIELIKKYVENTDI